MTGWEILL